MAEFSKKIVMETSQYHLKTINKMHNFEKSVFINCPIDADYRQMLLVIVFTVSHLGFIPRLSLERADSGESRIAKILKLIDLSKFGIHDISRIISAAPNEHYRMNMPFELGIDYGCQHLRENPWNTKKILILEKEKYRYQAALSDLSGSDIRHHSDEPLKLVRVVRDWFITEALGTGSSYSKIWYDFNDFNSELYDKLQELGHNEEDFDKVPIPEIMHYIEKWVKENTRVAHPIDKEMRPPA